MNNPNIIFHDEYNKLLTHQDAFSPKNYRKYMTGHNSPMMARKMAYSKSRNYMKNTEATASRK